MSQSSSETNKGESLSNEDTGQRAHNPSAGKNGRSKKGNSAQVARHAARELAVQALYQWQLQHREKSLTTIEVEFRSQQADDDMLKSENWVEVMGIADLALFHKLLQGVGKSWQAIDEQLVPLLDRSLDELDAIELAILRLGTYELMERQEVPYRVVINECIELAREFGATDGHKYVNGILDKLATSLRPIEVQARRR